VLDKVISRSQNAFIQILDSALVTNECLDSRIRSEDLVCFINWDFEKAYDHVNWGFFVVSVEEMWFWGGNVPNG
jgi:hypothetical protein